jgi:hypothetical protein
MNCYVMFRLFLCNLFYTDNSLKIFKRNIDVSAFFYYGLESMQGLRCMAVSNLPQNHICGWLDGWMVGPPV